MPRTAKLPPEPLMQVPEWPTAMRSRLADGRCIGVDNSVWLYRRVPLAPVTDARSPEASLDAAVPLMSAMSALADMAQVRLARRSASRGSYRQVHLLLVSVPRPFQPVGQAGLSGYLSEMMQGIECDRRILLLGVKLRERVSSGGFRRAISTVTEVLATGAVPLSAYEEDHQEVGGALARSGLVAASADDLRIAASWWSGGTLPDTPILEHLDHLHVFTSTAALAQAVRMGAEGDRCESWDHMTGAHSLCFGCVAELDLPYLDATSPQAHWASALLAAKASCISIRALVEPASVTRAELRRSRKRYEDDIAERVSQGKMDRAEQEETLASLTEVEAAYAAGQAPPGLVDASVLVAFSGRSAASGYDLSGIGREAGVILHTMAARQRSALAETMLCSAVRSVPYLHDLPAQTVAASGLPDLAVVGDSTGALVGFTERDRQPAWLSPTAAASEDQLPMMLVVGQTGSGKTVVGLWLADQFARTANRAGEQTPVVFIDPKQSSDLGAAVAASGGQVASLDDLLSADGIFDPLRFSSRLEAGVDMAASVLMQVNPWGSGRLDYEAPLQAALAYGVRQGATCTGQALRIAARDGQAPQAMVDRVIAMTESSPLFRACVGVDPQTTPLRLAGGVTLIRVGETYLQLPDPGGHDMANLNQRIALAVVRAMVFGTAAALAQRDGVLIVDEAWVVLSAGRTEVERLGRLARSQRVFPLLLTQRVTDALHAGLAGYISRGLILPITDPEEARAACELFRLAPTPERLGRLTAPATIGGRETGDLGAPNWSSMRALRDPQTRQVLRGAVGIYADLSGRAVPVEVVIPEPFLAIASTNPEDMARRTGAPSAPRTASAAPEPEPEPVPAAGGDAWADWGGHRRQP